MALIVLVGCAALGLRVLPPQMNAAALAAPKAELLAAITSYNEATAIDGVPSVDFGVSGGELDQDSRASAPRDLLTAGAFYGVSQRVGEAADRVVSAIEAITPFNPTPNPTKGLGEARGFRREDCPLPANGITSGQPQPMRRSRPILARCGNCLQHREWCVGKDDQRDRVFTARQALASSDAQGGPAAAPRVSQGCPLGARSFADARRAHLSPRPRARLNLALFGGRLKFGLTLILPVPGPFLTRLLFLFRPSKRPPLAYFDVLYLDDDLRVHRTAQGNLFVQSRPPAPEVGEVEGVLEG